MWSGSGRRTISSRCIRNWPTGSGCLKTASCFSKSFTRRGSTRATAYIAASRSSMTSPAPRIPRAWKLPIASCSSLSPRTASTTAVCSLWPTPVKKAVVRPRKNSTGSRAPPTSRLPSSRPSPCPMARSRITRIATAKSCRTARFWAPLSRPSSALWKARQRRRPMKAIQ